VTVNGAATAGEARETSLLEALWLYRRSSALIVAAFGIAAALLTMFVLGTVRATAHFAVTDPRSTDYLRQGVSTDTSFISYTAQRAAFAHSQDVLKRATQIIGQQGGRRYSLQRLRDAVEAKSDPNGAIVSVTASAPTTREAARIANAVVVAYQDRSAAQFKVQMEEQLASIVQSLKALATRLDEVSPTGSVHAALLESLAQTQIKEVDLRQDLARLGSGTSFVDQADPNQPAKSQVPANTIIGLAVGALLAAVVAFLRATSSPARASRPASGEGRLALAPRVPRGASAARLKARPKADPQMLIDSLTEAEARVAELQGELERYRALTPPGPSGKAATRDEQPTRQPEIAAAGVMPAMEDSFRQGNGSRHTSSQELQEAPTVVLPIRRSSRGTNTSRADAPHDRPDEESTAHPAIRRSVMEPVSPSAPHRASTEPEPEGGVAGDKGAEEDRGTEEVKEEDSAESSAHEIVDRVFGRDVGTQSAVTTRDAPSEGTPTRGDR
jgi:capsular polysaccharide biosynthesis protein